MNQAKNLIQWKNLTDDEKDGFDFENYDYEHQLESKTTWIDSSGPFSDDVYRLKIEPDKFYYWEQGSHKGVEQGRGIRGVRGFAVLRPAKPSEIPKPETLEDRVKAEYGDFDVVMLEWDQDVLLIRRQLTETFNSEFAHIEAQSMKGFAGYVYELGSDLSKTNLPTYSLGEVLKPIAAIFSRGEG